MVGAAVGAEVADFDVGAGVGAGVLPFDVGGVVGAEVGAGVAPDVTAVYGADLLFIL